jgi:hypothetical protein
MSLAQFGKLDIMQIADSLVLPVDVVTEKLAFLGRTGSGKTYAAMKLAELMLDAGAQIVTLDPVGAWHGLRIGGPWNVYIFGGLRGDFPLEPTGGKLLADLITDRGISAVLDVSQFIRSEQVRFACDFIERFFNKKKASPSAVHLFLEECQEFAPQNPGNNEAHMLHHFERLWKLGRGFGIGGSLISQRPQEVNKKVLNQSGTLFVFQMTGPQERKAIGEWTKEHGIDDDIQGLLPTLKVGQPHVWSPTFLKVSKTVKIASKLTADVSMTPKVGARIKEQPLTPIDAEKLKAEMAATIEKAKADDPRELRKQISDLKRQLAPQTAKVERVDVATFTEADRIAIDGILQVVALFKSDLDAMANTLDGIRQICERVGAVRSTKPAPAKLPTPTPKREAARRENDALGKCERSILQVLSQFPEGCDSGRLTLLTGYRYSGGFKNSLSTLRQNGLIVGENTGVMQITEDGLRLGPFDPMPSGQALIDYWLNHRSFGQCERRILGELVQHPKGLTAAQLCELTDYQYSGGFKNALSNLRTAGVITGRNTETMKASDALFE